MTHLQTQVTRPAATYTQGDVVLFRDAERFWLGQSGHTFVGRVVRAWRQAYTGKVLYDLVELSGNRHRSGIDPDYMRLLPPADAMRDVDTAPLSEPDTGAMTPAAVAWLRQQLAQDAGLPVPRA
ncbi:hypothetical protein [Streptomyces spectabilis]|uniref:Uncharacterized protein n=1 Tax=Streptomyces spectabilis TaxID=68270 RepID=A0A7W8B3C2_STRST|nr:hypothetical protein [Streptomyces spectabilis]MBB5109187.1 hypothetical protein [Streptomyces spectabilis]MCI3907744.1 hypothetical protein [Streptomyces spectabilis]GGV51270.1 hypothetical protein GCM10010245_80780 [Streptomyces spectabilis]